METAQLFNTFIDLPKSAYFFTQRVTFWQALFNVLAIFFISIDTAIEDVIMTISHNLRRKFEEIAVGISGIFCPRMVCA